MAELTQTATSVVKGTGAKAYTGYAGAAVTAGQPVYIDTADSDTIKPCLSSATPQPAAATGVVVAGIALNGAATGQTVTYQYEGQINLGATLAAGALYVVGDSTTGKIGELSDLDAGDYVTFLGIAISTSLMEMGILVGPAKG